jgi:hypothetical protein
MKNFFSREFIVTLMILLAIRFASKKKVLGDKHFYDILRRTIVLHQTYARPILALG